MPNSNTKILIFADHTTRTKARSGIQRVVVELSKAVCAIGADVDFVKWDVGDGQLRYFDDRDLDLLFGDDRPDSAEPHAFAHRRRYRFGDTLPKDRSVWLIYPEISYHLEHGNEIFSRIVAQCREYGVKVGAVFYDLIPITNAFYRDYSPPHVEYVNQLSRCDLILPISRYSARTLMEYYCSHVTENAGNLVDLLRRIVPLPLAEVNSNFESAVADKPEKRDVILLLGTIEPRKQQVEVLKCFKRLPPEVTRDIKVMAIGSLHPAVAEEFRELMRDDPRISYPGYLSDAEIGLMFNRALFSVFASNDEGFGLPICESLARGVPCIAANFGSMIEIAEGGGCLAVDVNNPAEIEQAMHDLLTKAGLRDKLATEIEDRCLRDWNDYAVDLIGFTEVFDPHRKEEVENFTLLGQARDLIRSIGNTDRHIAVSTLQCDDFIMPIYVMTGMTEDHLQSLKRELPAERLGPYAIVFNFPANARIGRMDQEAIKFLCGAEAWFCTDRDMYDGLVQLDQFAKYPGMLPVNCAISGLEDLPDVIVRRVSDIKRFKDRLSRFAHQDEMLMEIARSTRASEGETRKGPLLTVVISTFNRAKFVEKNVAWLMSLTRDMQDKVRIVVVDNASSDDTLSRLHHTGFAGCMKNSSNVGMLGNLNVVSTLLLSRHVWIIGDDDFIMPDAIPRVLAVLEENPEIPMVMVNFGIYHRERVADGDTAEGYLAERVLLAPNASPSGMYTVREVATEHDNLFTAIYPIVFRADIAAACFNYPFTGEPFGGLVESVPTTKIILESYADAPAYWITETGIVGNAFNSWRRYRVRWHGVLMPAIFELAKKAGVNDRKLHAWSRIHVDLFKEAADLFPDEDWRAASEKEAVEASLRVFRQRL